MLGTPTITECDREPIHLLGTIQPIGFLLSLNGDWTVVRASENVAEHLGAPPAAVLGQPAMMILPADLLHDIRGRLQQAGDSGLVEPLFGQRVRAGGPPYAIATHQSGDELVLEFERAAASPDAPAPAPTAVRGMMARVERHESDAACFREAARQMRALTGFDRVMVYRFDDAGHGEVVGESVGNGVASFLGLRYPASDIPAQARELYARQLTRIIVDVDAAPVPVTPALSPEGAALDLSMSVLRSVSPIHLEYLRNMEVRASMSVSILREGRLWGLIACHHRAPRHIDLQTRLASELFGQMFGYFLEVRERAADARYEARAQLVHSRVAAAFVDAGAALGQAPSFLAGLSDYVASDGIGIFHAGEVNLIGLTPTREEFLHLLKFLNKTAAGRVFSTHHLASVFPPAADYPMRAAGILSVPISRVPRDYLVFFRRETVQTVTWAGEPEKPATPGPNGVRLTPRKSFAAWRETVEGMSEPWRKRELRAAEALRLTLIEAVLRISDQSQAERLAAQHRQEILIAELNHRVRNLLGLIRGLVVQAAAATPDVATLVQGLDERIAAMARSYDLLILGSWETASLHSLLRAEFEAYGEAEGERLRLRGPDVQMQPRAFAAMAMLAHELVTNARKHGALKLPGGHVVVETGADAVDNITVAWRESGGPPVQPPSRRGFGSMILEQAIPFEVNGASVPQYTPTGFRLDVLLPAAVATAAPPIATPPAVAAPGPSQTAAVPALPAAAPGAADLSALLADCLVVEDNLFIAIDAEDVLRRLGAGHVIVARTVAEALALHGERRFSFALLDVNLGAETSLPVARALLAAGTAFVFATGYGESMALPDALAEAPVISKPLQAVKLAQALRRLAGAADAAARQGRG